MMILNRADNKKPGRRRPKGIWVSNTVPPTPGSHPSPSCYYVCYTIPFRREAGGPSGSQTIQSIEEGEAAHAMWTRTFPQCHMHESDTIAKHGFLKYDKTGGRDTSNKGNKRENILPGKENTGAKTGPHLVPPNAVSNRPQGTRPTPSIENPPISTNPPPSTPPKPKHG